MKVPTVSVGNWITLTEDGLGYNDSNRSFQYPSRKEAVLALSYSYADQRPTPKVKRLYEGEYEYFPKEDGRFRFPIVVRKVTEKNVEYLNRLLKDQWENDPLSVYDEEEIN